MADIAPFRAIRYGQNKVGMVSDVIAPPYDVISPELQDRLYTRHPNNIIRIDLNKSEPGDAELSRYERAASIFHQWMEEGVLIRDLQPAYYTLSQTFQGPDGITRTRTGLFACVRLTRFGEGPVLPHERTLTGPKLDRLRLFRATKANLSPIFMMYQDPEQEVLEVLESIRREEPLIEAEMDKVENRLWRITDEARLSRISSVIKPKKLYIADGHHRYETGLAYRDERRAEGGGAPPSGEPAYEHILTFAAAVEDPGMVVFPTHRLVHSLEQFDERAFLTSLARYFEITPTSSAPKEMVEDLARKGQDRNAFVVVTPRGASLIALKEDAPLDSVASLPSHPALRRLDVTILHSVILEHVLSISREAQASQQNLRYSKDAAEAASAPTREPDVQVALIMNPTKVREVIDVSNIGEVMPQKSTFFYPKIPSGLVLYALD